MSRRGSAVLAEEELIDLNIELQANPRSENAKKAKSVLLNHKAIEAAGKNKLDEALNFVDQAIELDQSNRTLKLNKAEYLARKNKFNDAIEICAKLVETNAEDYAARHQLIAYLNNAFEGDMECGKHAEALVNIDKALKLSPKDKYILYNRAATLWNLGRYDDALKAADNAADLDAKFSSPRTLKAIILNHMALKDAEENRVEEALKKVNKAIELKPNEVAFHINKASFLVTLEKLNEAKECIEKALELDSDNKDALHLKDVIHRKTAHFIVKEPRRVSLGYIVPQQK